MKTYILTLKHDNGTVKIRVFADSIQGAINAVTKAENCPECAIINIKVLTNNKTDMKKYIIYAYEKHGKFICTETETENGTLLTGMFENETELYKFIRHTKDVKIN